MIIICKGIKTVETTDELLAYFREQSEPSYYVALSVDEKKLGQETKIVAELKIRETEAQE